MLYKVTLWHWTSVWTLRAKAYIVIEFKTYYKWHKLHSKLTGPKNLNLNGMDEWTDERKVASSNRHNFLNNDMFIVICVKFHHEGTLASLKLNLTKNFNLSGMNKNVWTDRQTDKQIARTPIRHEFLNNDMLMVIRVKFHQERTLASLKTNLTKNFNLSERREERSAY